ncbi:hypothetical protein O9K51_09210 [Purpureocillium lavendulum]|uniref:Zn(2)-C6 fungal-type domain-containing protein n=1 Tax=Purpureocillium lavendulum TaxID=1247861 RepID=A0AB34FIF9_9HYPO|nr:hypothetical protein O9K51_09210 [Purpureocillium lavendulum]
MTPARGCGTCRDRRVLCDRAVPVCQRCVQSRRTCSGYGVRLSWPGSKRRTRSKPESALAHARASGPFYKVDWLNTSFADIEMYYDTAYTGPKPMRGGSWGRPNLPLGLPATSWMPFKLDDEQKRLCDYFETAASRSLPTFGYDSKAMCSVILPMAMSDHSASSTAVLLSLLALAALHRDGPQHQAARLKLGALRALEASVLEDSSTKDLLGHVAAGMLLCSYEIQKSTKTSAHWLWYLCGAMTIIKSGHLDRPNQDGNITLLLGWTQYYVTMARFSLRHWMRSDTMEFAFARDVGYHDVMPPVCTRSSIEGLNDAPHKLLDLLGRVIDTVVEDTKPHYHSKDYRQGVEGLESTLTSADSPWRVSQPSPGSTSTGDANSMELFRLTGLVYLGRAAESILRHPTQLDNWISQAFNILAGLEVFRYPLPLLILGCEARTDEQRMMVLGIIDRTLENAPTVSITYVKSMVRFLWVHDDLIDDNRGYLSKLSAAISSSQALPIFI